MHLQFWEQKLHNGTYLQLHNETNKERTDKISGCCLGIQTFYTIFLGLQGTPNAKPTIVKLL